MTLFKCPVCDQPLTADDSKKLLFCSNNHRYDFAKEGYVNLLLAHKKQSKNPGDDNMMMACRQAFLNKGYYQILADAIAEKLKSITPSRILDIGCAEGYYGDHIHKRLPNTELVGVDIAKGGVRLAAKRKSYDHLTVASAYDIPIMQATIDAAFCVFSPFDEAELCRVLTPKGYLIIVGPTANHLQALAECVYDQFKPHDNGYSLLDESCHFKKVAETIITKEITVKGEDIHNLLTMTPYYWSASQEKQEAIKMRKELTTPLAFQIKIYQRTT